MAIDTRLGLAAQAPDVGAAFGQGLVNVQRMQQIGEAPLRNRLLQTQAALGEQQLSDAQRDAELKSIALGVESVWSDIEGGDLNSVINKLGQRLQTGATVVGGRGMVDTQNVYDQIIAAKEQGIPDEQIMQGLKQEIGQTRQGLINTGYIKVSPEDSKIREETRADLGSRFTKFDEALSSLETNYNKVSGLSEAIKKKNRYAVAQGLISTVKLGEPNSAVLTAEMEAQLNQKDPFAAVVQSLQAYGAKGLLNNENLAAAIAKIDPLNPDNVNVDDLLQVASTVVGAQLEGLNNQYGQYQETGQTLSEAGRKRIFSKSREDRLKNLSEKVTKSTSGSSSGSPQISDGVIIENEQGQRFILTNGQWKPYNG